LKLSQNRTLNGAKNPGDVTAFLYQRMGQLNVNYSPSPLFPQHRRKIGGQWREAPTSVLYIFHEEKYIKMSSGLPLELLTILCAPLERGFRD